MSSELVLVSGATGFVGSQVALEFLKNGYRQVKADEWMSRHSSPKGMEWAIVEDIVAPGAFKQAIKGVTIFAHTASPFHFDVKDPVKDMLEPAIEGTKNALEAAASENGVKRVVVTSSFAAVLDMASMPGVGKTYTHEDWNPATFDEAAKSDQPPFIYCASKKLAEEEAWKFVKEKQPSFALSTICPPMILGPPQQVIRSVKNLNTSVEAVWGVVDAKEIPPTEFPVWTDVRDIARLHFLAATEDVAKGQRYLTIAGYFDNTEVASIMRSRLPDETKGRVKEVEPMTDHSKHFQTVSSKAEKDFSFKWRSLQESIVDTAKELFKLEKKLAGK